MKKSFLFLSLVSSIGLFSQSWNTTGNSGTNSNINFIGTTDNQSLVFKINNSEKLRITTNGRLVFYNNNSQTFSNNLYIGGGNEIPSNNAGGVNWGNVAVGLGTMNANSTGTANTAIGFNSLATNTTGNGNTSLGINSMRNTTISNYNTAIGINTIQEIASGNENTAVGMSAMSGLPNYTASNNIAIGSNALRGISNGNYNTIVGSNSYRIFRTGSNNIVLGYNNLSSYELFNVNNNIFIGNNIIPINSQPNNELNIGNWIFGSNGKISIGGKVTFTCTDCTNYSLFVKNGIKTEKVKVDIAANNGWADYVFNKSYKLMPIKDLQTYIDKNGHLPEVPTTEEAINNGIELKEMNILLLKKVEELTLYIIEQNKRIETLEQNSNNK